MFARRRPTSPRTGTICRQPSRCSAPKAALDADDSLHRVRSILRLTVEIQLDPGMFVFSVRLTLFGVRSKKVVAARPIESVTVK